VIQLDTNALIRRELIPHKLSQPARSAIEAAVGAGEAIAISSITLWEIALLTGRSRIQLKVPIAKFFKEIVDNYTVFEITGAIAIQAEKLQLPFPKDPMDRLIAATAIVKDLTLITADQAILDSKVCNLVW